jgi:hypothetical protein
LGPSWRGCAAGGLRSGGSANGRDDDEVSRRKDTFNFLLLAFKVPSGHIVLYMLPVLESPKATSDEGGGFELPLLSPRLP